MRKKRPLAMALIGLVLAQGASAIPSPQADADTAAFLDQAEAQLRPATDAAQCPPAFWDWLHHHADIRAGLLLAAHPAKPLHAQNLAQLWRAAGEKRADRFASLLLAGALQDHPADQAQTPSEVAGAMEGTGPDRAALAAGRYPPRVEVSALVQIIRQIKRQQTSAPDLKDGIQWPLFPLQTAPYYLLNPFAQSVPGREQDFVWERFCRPKGKQSRVLAYADAVYGWEYTKPDVRQKKSAWHPDSIPRILEDGGVCGRLARMEATGKAVLGIPASTAGQPGHCALMFVTQDQKGQYGVEIGQSESGTWSNTVPHVALGASPAIAGFEREAVSWLALAETANRVKSAAYAQSLALAWMAQDAKAPQAKAQLLGQAVAANPYHLAAWMALAQSAAAQGSRPFNQVMGEMAHALKGKTGERIARVLVRRLVADAYRPWLEKAADDKAQLAAVVGDYWHLIEQLDDAGVLEGSDIYPLYLRHAAKIDPKQALEVAQANLEMALLGRREDAGLLDESASKTFTAVRGLQEVCACLPVAQRAEVWAQVCEKIGAVYPHFEVVARPELIGGQTLYPKRVVANKFHAQAQAQWWLALRETHLDAEVERQRAVYEAERKQREREIGR